MNKIIKTPLMLLALASTSNAAVVSFDVSQGSAGINTGSGVTSASNTSDETGVTTSVTSSTDAGTGVTTFSYTLTNIDVDGFGTADEIVTYDLLVTQYSSASVSGGVLSHTLNLNPEFSNGNMAGGADTGLDTSFSATLANVTYTAGSDDPTAVLSFANIVGVSLGGASTGLLSDGTASDNNLFAYGVSESSMTLVEAAAGSPLLIGSSYAVSATDTVFGYSSLSDDVNAWRSRMSVDLNFGIQVVPEPSSTALLGLGALALTVRRKR